MLANLAILAQEAAEEGITNTGLGARAKGHAPRGPGPGLRVHAGPAGQPKAPPPPAAGMVRTTMFLGIAFVEALALIGFVVFFLGQA